MGDPLYGCLSILVYLFINLIVIPLSFGQYRESEKSGVSKKKLSIVCCILVSLVYALYNKFNTVPQVMGGDRQNYLQDFNGRSTGYEAFDIFLRIVFEVTNGDFFSLLYLTTFLCVFVLLVSYKYSRQGTPYALMFYFSTNYVFFTFTGLKQAIAGIFFNLFFLVMLWDSDKRVKDLIGVFLIMMACSMHVTGYILIPVFFLLKLDFNTEIKRISITAILLALIVLFEPIMLGLSRVLNSAIPMLSTKISEYLGEDSIQSTGTVATVLRGVPYYMLCFFAISDHHFYASKIKNFDRMFLLAIVASLLSVSTVFSYWLSRAASCLIFPVGLLFGQMFSVSDAPRQRQQLLLFVLLPMLFFTLRSAFLVFSIYGGF